MRTFNAMGVCKLINEKTNNIIVTASINAKNDGSAIDIAVIACFWKHGILKQLSQMPLISI